MQKKILKFTLLIFFLFTIFPPTLQAAECSSADPCSSIGDPITRSSCYNDVVNACLDTKQSLVSQITYFSSKISLTSSQIEATQKKIDDLEDTIASLSGRINNLEESLNRVSNVLLERISQTYKKGGTSYFSLLLSSKEFTDLFLRLRFIQIVQEHDKRLLIQTQRTKVNFEEQKRLREEKQAEQAQLKSELESQKVLLDKQKIDKENFLALTRNNESRYEQLLAEARREAAEIQRAISILSQAGVAKHVNRGDTIGLMGNTGFSTGAHLHFGVYNLAESDLNKFNFDSGHENPFNFLSSKELRFDSTSCDDVSSATNKSAGSGGWPWPMENPNISQCYGHTPWSWRYRSGIHNALDMWNNSNIVIRAVEEGNAYTYRGGQSGGNGVFIFHNNGKMTLYWHLQ
ncbi:peptidoglycan DD-metalloendopeptidase family protein [Candidatus Gottesmanbacteria bacterium]|nr:peptidoglycan DD-metalloendopeptidase family protein [Candidatus Gottesmanbacteria bacterium]